MENNLQVANINGVNCYEKDGTAYLDIEAVARGLGFTQKKHGVEYVKWERVNSYLNELGFSPLVGKGDYIPENIFYRLAMKAKNETAEKFQALVADKIIPTIRKTGGYVANDELFISTYLPTADEATKLMFRTTLSTVRRLNEEKANLLQTVSAKNQQILEMQPKVRYYDIILQSASTMPVSQIAKDYGMSAKEFNKTLHELGIQYKQGNIWLLYQKYAQFGYTQSKTFTVNDKYDTKLHTYWTQKGRLFLYDLLKNNGILPLIERE